MDEDIYDESNLFTSFEKTENSDELVSSRRPLKNESAGLSELDSLRQENVFLKKLIRNIGFNPSEDEPLANILFYNGMCSRGTQGELEDFICRVLARATPTVVNKKINSYEGSSQPCKRNMMCDGFAAALGRISDCAKLHNGETGDLEHDISGLPVGCIKYFNLCCLDTLGSTMERIFPTPPHYEPPKFKTLPETAGIKVSQRRKQVCFNCDGNHVLSKCPKRRDLARISMKRQEFMQSKFDSRYHEDQSKFEQYQHLVPGKISKNLREALALQDRDLPPYIYRMRMLGYPPGWMPSNHDSGIVMYGKEGKEEQNLNESNRSDPAIYVHFPGFNVPVPRDCKDLANDVHLPQMQKRCQLDVKPEDNLASSENKNHKRSLSSEEYDSSCRENKRMRRSSDMEVENDSENNAENIDIVDESDLAGNTSSNSQERAELEDGEIAESPGGTDMMEQRSWWLNEPLMKHLKNDKQEFAPPPFPLRPLPLHKISQILPGELNHISYEDRSRWLDPIFGNLQVRTGRFDKLKTILASRENKRKRKSL